MGQGLWTVILIDTDVLIDFFRGHEKAIAFLKSHSSEIALSSIVVAELYAGIKDDEREQVDDFISLFPVFPVTLGIAKSGGLLRRDYHPSHGVRLADALLAATALAHNAQLKTLNVKHYPMLKGLKPPYIKR